MGAYLEKTAIAPAKSEFFLISGTIFGGSVRVKAEIGRIRRSID